jgi:D-amino-acid oxidase
MDKNKSLVPELLNEKGVLDFISDGVGLRPHRQGGVRLEIERSKGTGDKNVVHCYGHSHGG